VATAGALTCPSCGAGVPAAARRCVHCETPVATVRCAACFHMNFREAAHCTGCGRDLGLEPIPRDGALACPDGHGAMTILDCGPGALHDCARCGGQFVEVAALRDLLEKHDRVDVTPPSRDGLRVEARVRYVACPVCQSLMNRRNFGGSSGVIVDVCTRHGTWFDAGELPRVLAFAEHGGLARKRAREAAEHDKALRERTAAASEVIAHGASEPETGSFVTDLLAALFRD